MNRLETKQAKKELRQARKKYREKTGVVSYYLNDNSDNIRNSQSHKDNTQKLTSAKKELRSAKKELRQAKKSAVRRELGRNTAVTNTPSRSIEKSGTSAAASRQKIVPNNAKIKQGKELTNRSGANKTKLTKSENTRLDKASKAVRDKKAKVRELKYDRKENIRQKKREARFDTLEKRAEFKAKRSASNGVLAGKKREYALQKKLAKYEKPTSMIGGKVKQLASSAKSRLINADPDNGTLQAAGKLIDVTSKASGAAVGTYKLLNRAEIQAAAKVRDKSRQINQSKLHANKQRLDRQRAANRKPPSYKNRPKPKEAVTKKVKEFFKNVAASAGGAGAKVLAAGAPIVLVVLFSAMLIYLLLSSVAGMFESGIVWTMGTYPTDDFMLGRAEKEYTRIAKEFNKDIINVGNKNKWKDTLSDKFGADKSTLSSTPKNWYWGKSEEFDWDPEYDFDPYKLWAFLCSYYAEFTDEGEPKITKWEYTDDTEELLQELFDEEYEFVFKYNDDGYWDELSDYNYYPDEENCFWFNDGNADLHAWSDCFDLEDPPGGKLSGFTDGDTRMYFDPDTLEILDIREKGDSSSSDLYGYDGYKRTGYYLVNQYYDDYNCDRYFYDDWDSDIGEYVHTYSDGSTTVCHSNEDYPYLISGDDINWADEDISHDVWGWQYFQKEEWIEDTALYYNVKQKKSFEDAIKDKLKVMPNGDDRVSIYEMYMGEDGAPDIHGGHQSYANILPGDSFYEDYIEAGKVVTGFGWSMSEWNENNHIYEEKNWEHKGIDILVDKDTEVYAAIDGKITWLNADKGIIRIRTDAFRYFYEAGESDEDVDGRDTEVIYYNVSAVDTLSYGDTVKAGELIGYTNGASMCDKNKDNSSYISDPYLHLQVNIDKDGFGWEYVDPRPLIP